MKRTTLTFGELVKSLRARERLGLREFCLMTGIDPSNWSKIERGIKPPPQDTRTLNFYAESLGLQNGTNEWKEIFDLAATAKGLIPLDLREEDFVAKLPAFFRTMREHNVTPEELERIIKFIENDYGFEEDVDER